MTVLMRPEMLSYPLVFSFINSTMPVNAAVITVYQGSTSKLYKDIRGESVFNKNLQDDC